MDIKKLVWIKAMQREYRRLFNEHLFIDFNTMNGVEEFPITKIKKLANQNRNDKDYINGLIGELCLRHDVKLTQVRENRKKPAEKSLWMDKYRCFMADLSRMVIDNSLNQAMASSIINKNRTVFYHYYSEKPIIHEHNAAEINS